MTAHNIADLKYLYYGGGSDAEYAYLLAASVAGHTATELFSPVTQVSGLGFDVSGLGGPAYVTQFGPFKVLADGATKGAGHLISFPRSWTSVRVSVVVGSMGGAGNVRMQGGRLGYDLEAATTTHILADLAPTTIPLGTFTDLDASPTEVGGISFVYQRLGADVLDTINDDVGVTQVIAERVA